jgi:heme-degrading monooxygenase HmoA
MDEEVPLRAQLQEERGPVVVMNVFRVKREDADAFQAAWRLDAEYFRHRPGHISAQLHRGVAGSGVFFNYAVWESIRHFREAFENPEFRSKLAAFPVNAVASPHIYEKVAVPGICVA